MFGVETRLWLRLDYKTSSLLFQRLTNFPTVSQHIYRRTMPSSCDLGNAISFFFWVKSCTQICDLLSVAGPPKNPLFRFETPMYGTTWVSDLLQACKSLVASSQAAHSLKLQLAARTRLRESQSRSESWFFPFYICVLPYDVLLFLRDFKGKYWTPEDVGYFGYGSHFVNTL